MTTKDVQAKHIADAHLLDAVDILSRERDGDVHWVMRWDLEERLAQFPEKVVMAKCRRLIKRGLLDGCTCGCRGDFELTDAGRELIAGKIVVVVSDEMVRSSTLDLRSLIQLPK